MPRPPRLRLLPALPRDPAATRRNLSPAELARRWNHWHPDEHTRATLPLDDDDVDARVRELAWLVLEQLWDELAARGCRTGELVDFETFPSPIGGFRPRFGLVN